MNKNENCLGQTPNFFRVVFFKDIIFPDFSLPFAGVLVTLFF